MNNEDFPVIAKTVTIGSFVFLFVVCLFSGCASTSKIQKALDEQYARGFQEGKAIQMVQCESGDQQRSLMNFREQLRQCNKRLDECLFSGMEK